MRNLPWSKGVEYEERVQRWFQQRYGSEFRSDLWFWFETDEREGWLKPDGLLRLGQRCVLIEVKLFAAAKMWWQLRHIYGPVIQKWLEGLTGPPLVLCDLGVARSYQLPFAECPEQPYLIEEPEQVRPQGFWLMRKRVGELRDE